jgi:hypothetical protein
MTEKNVNIKLDKSVSSPIKEKKYEEDEVDISVSEIVVPTLEHEQNIIVNKKTTNNTCQTCKKKIGLLDTTLKCKCGGVFCTTHRHFTKHSCDYDYKNGEKIKLVKIVGDKINKI